MPQPDEREVLISVDVETSGPTPGTGSLIAIGACLVARPDIGFYRELQPLPGLPWDTGAERVHGLSEQRLLEQGLPPAAAMADMGEWVESVCDGGWPVFVDATLGVGARKLLDHAANVVESAVAICVWEAEDEPWVYLAVSFEVFLKDACFMIVLL